MRPVDTPTFFEPARPPGAARHRLAEPLEAAPDDPGSPDPDHVDPMHPDPIRRAVVDRLAIAGRRHSRYRVERSARVGRPGPHAVVFLFRESEPDSPDRVTVASRMFVDGPDVADLPHALATLTDRAREYSRPLPDLIAYLADRIEPRGRDSSYLGLAVSSIDVAREDRDPMPWDGLAHLVDGTRMTLHGTRPELAPQVRSTHTLAHLGPLWAQQTPTWATSPVAATARTDLADAHGKLAALHGELRGAEPAWV
jgi:hypothetical protein